MKLKYVDKAMDVLVQQLLNLAPDDVPCNPKSLEGETVKHIIDTVKKLALKFDPEKGQLFSSIPWGHIVNAADKQPDKTREGLVSLISILDDYKQQIRRVE